MPKSKKKIVWNDFPALTRLLEEIKQYREREQTQPRLPFEPPATNVQSKPDSGENKNKTKRAKDKPAATK